jgi:capsular exopolysaccharide synthesis family protein
MLRDADEQLPEEIEGPHQANPLELFWIAWRRKSLIFLCAAVGLALGGLYYAQAKPVYRSEAQVLVVSKHPDVMSEGAAGMLQDYVTTHRVLMQSPLVIAHAVDEAKLGSLESFAGIQGSPTEAIGLNLSVDRVIKDVTAASRDNVLKLSFSGPIPDDCRIVVDALLESYKKFLAETYRDMSAETVKLITEARDLLDKDLDKTEVAYRELRLKSPMIWRGKDEVNPLQDRLTMIELQRSALMLRRADYEGQLRVIEKARKSGRTNDELVALVSQLADKPDAAGIDRNAAGNDRYAAATLKVGLLPLLVEEQTLEQNFGPRHPQVLAARDRIEEARNFFTLPTATYSNAASRSRKSRESLSANLVDLYVRYLSEEMDRMKTSEQALDELYVKEHVKARELTSYEIQDMDFQRKIVRMDALYDGVVKRLQEASMVKDYGGFDARIIAPPGTGKQVAPKALIVFPGSAFLGIFFGVGLVYLAEVTDKRFRTPDEVRRRLGVRVMSHVPPIHVDDALREKAASNGDLDPMLIAYHQPRSPAAEAFRTLRTALYFSSLGAGHKAIEVTSPEPGDGKSTLAANLAVSIAQSGKRTLLVDADLRKPRIGKMFHIASEAGLASVLGQGVEVADAIQATAVSDLWVLPAGPRPPDPAELLTSPHFADLLDLLREKYDYVVVDTPPLLPVTDACVVAPRVDGVLLTIRISKHGRPHAERAKEILNSLGAELTGIVVNGPGEKGSRDGYGGYGYGRYGYGRYGNGRYGYGSYGYGTYGDGTYGYGGYGDGDQEHDDETDQNADEGANGQKTAGRFASRLTGKDPPGLA